MSNDFTLQKTLYIKNGVPSAESSRSVRGLGKGQWQALPSPVQCEETATRTRDLPVTGGKTLPLAPGPPFAKDLIYQISKLLITLVQNITYNESVTGTSSPQ